MLKRKRLTPHGMKARFLMNWMSYCGTGKNNQPRRLVIFSVGDIQLNHSLRTNQSWKDMVASLPIPPIPNGSPHVWLSRDLMGLTPKKGHRLEFIRRMLPQTSDMFAHPCSVRHGIQSNVETRDPEHVVISFGFPKQQDSRKPATSCESLDLYSIVTLLFFVA
ncbi:hypothetical protein PIB30_015066 [Stylosanthes scabra]|uniref:Uncharacterized protein n=1 Tax=Stylosanthes scabra TaxID=79078 RepID=A0ABU6Q7T5_9FABA|nr:hypothetical protein [Stylosanthes scabra]